MNTIKITDETKAESVVFLGGRMISIISTAGELKKEAKDWGIKWFSGINWNKEVIFYNYANIEDRFRIINSDVKIVVKFPGVEENILEQFSNELIKYVGAYEMKGEQQNEKDSGIYYPFCGRKC